MGVPSVPACYLSAESPDTSPPSAVPAYFCHSVVTKDGDHPGLT